MSSLTVALLLVCVALNTIAQILLKAGVKTLGTLDLGITQLWRTVWALFLERHIFAGLVCYVASVIVWLAVLSRTEVSIAYPMSSLGFVATAITAWLLFNEPLTPTRIAGILVIVAGVFLVARS